MSPVTDLLRLVSQGDSAAEEQLVQTLYRELRQLAAGCMRGERAEHTLQPTALVNEAFLRLLPQRGKDWQSRGHFLAVAGQVMRRVLVDYARAKKSKKRPGHLIRLELDENLPIADMGWESQMIDVDTALRKLAVLDPRQARVIESRFFAGMTEAEIAVQVGVSERTIKRDCKAGIAWLHAELNGTPKSTAATKS